MQINEDRRVEYEVVIEGSGVGSSGEGSSGVETFVVEDSIGYLMNYAARSLARRQSERLEARGAHLGQWAVLMFLWSKDGQSQTELSRHVVIENATMVRTIDRMERDGLVRRVRSEQDRRRTDIFLTEKGWSLRDELIPCAIATNEEATRTFTVEEKRQFEDYLRRMISSLRDTADDEQERKR